MSPLSLLISGVETFRAERAEARQAGFLECAFGFLGAAAQGEFKTRYFAIVTINYCSQMAQPSAPHGTWVRSMAQRSSLRCARLLRPWTRGRGVAAR